MRRPYLHCNSNIRGDISTEIRNNFTVQFYVKPQTSVSFQTESNSGTAGTNSNPYLMTPAFHESSTSETGFGVVVGTNGIMVVEHSASYAPCTCVVQHNIGTNWTWVTVTVENKRATVWIDGVKVRTGVASAKSNVRLAHTFGGGSWGSYNGDVMEVSYYSYVLTEKEILDGVKKGTWQLKQGLEKYYKCNEGEGSAIRDIIGGDLLELGTEAWEVDEVEFYPYLPPVGRGIMYNTKSYSYDNPQILHRGVKYKGCDPKGNKVGLVGSNVLEGADIGDSGSELSMVNATLSYGVKDKVDIFSEIQNSKNKEASVNDKIYNQISRTFPPASAFKSGTFDNYSMIIRNLDWGNANFLAFPTSAIQKVYFKSGETVVCNEDFMVGDVRGYQVVERNKTTQIVYEGVLEVYPKKKVTDIAFMSLLDRPRVFDIFNNIYPPEYEFNPSRDEDDGIIRPPHAEVYDLFESFNPYSYSDEVVSLRGNIPYVNGGVCREQFSYIGNFYWHDSAFSTLYKVGVSFLYEDNFKEDYTYNSNIILAEEEKMNMKRFFRSEFNKIQEIEEEYVVLEAPFDIVNFKSIEQIDYEE